MLKHEFKVWPGLFNPMMQKDGCRMFEAHADHSQFEQYDQVVFREWVPKDHLYPGQPGYFTGETREVHGIIRHIHRGGKRGMLPGYCMIEFWTEDEYFSLGIESRKNAIAFLKWFLRNPQTGITADAIYDKYLLTLKNEQ